MMFKYLLLSCALMSGCAGGQILKAPQRNSQTEIKHYDSVGAVEVNKESHLNIYAIVIWLIFLLGGIYLFIRNERSPKQ